MFGGKRGKRPADRAHPFGYGPERYFWSFVVALVLFSMGGLFALYEGIQKLLHPHEIENADRRLRASSASSIVLSRSRCAPRCKEANHVRSGTLVVALHPHAPRRRSCRSCCSRTSAPRSVCSFALFGLTHGRDHRQRPLGRRRFDRHRPAARRDRHHPRGGDEGPADRRVGERRAPRTRSTAAIAGAAAGERPHPPAHDAPRPRRAAGGREDRVRPLADRRRAGRRPSTPPRLDLRAAVPIADLIYIEPDIRRKPPRSEPDDPAHRRLAPLGLRSAARRWRVLVCFSVGSHAGEAVAHAGRDGGVLADGAVQRDLDRSSCGSASVAGCAWADIRAALVPGHRVRAQHHVLLHRRHQDHGRQRRVHRRADAAARRAARRSDLQGTAAARRAGVRADLAWRGWRSCCSTRRPTGEFTWTASPGSARATCLWATYLLTSRSLRQGRSVAAIMAAITPIATVVDPAARACSCSPGTLTQVTWRSVVFIVILGAAHRHGGARPDGVRPEARADRRDQHDAGVAAGAGRALVGAVPRQHRERHPGGRHGPGDPRARDGDAAEPTRRAPEAVAYTRRNRTRGARTTG